MLVKHKFMGKRRLMKAFWYNENRKNLCGIKIRELRKQQKLTQKQLAIKAQLSGYDFITETAIIKLELGTRFIPDYEVAIFAQILGTTPDELLKVKDNLLESK
jgi:transcriptional regulator with XRE-family HTH domain